MTASAFDQLIHALHQRRVVVADSVIGKHIVSEKGRLLVFGPGSAEVPVAEFPQDQPDLAAEVYEAIDGQPRLWASSYLPRAGGDQESRLAVVHAAGATPWGCVVGFLDSRGEGPAVDLAPAEPGPSDELIVREDGTWSARFSGTSSGFKAGGLLVPGGAIMTWWE